MNKIKIFFRKYWLFILLATLVTILALFYFIQKEISPQKETNLLSLSKPEIKNLSTITPNLNELEKNFPSFSKTLEVYQVDKTLITDQQAVKIAQNFDFKENPSVTNYIQGPLYNWANSQATLTIYLKEGRFQYVSNQGLIKGEPPAFKEAENKLKEILKEKELLPPEKIKTEISQENFYFSNGTNFIKTTSDNPQKSFAFIEFIYKINNFRIDGPETPLISVYFANNLQIVRFDFSKIFEKIDSLNFYPLKTKDEIIKNLKENPRISFLKDIKSFYQENLISGEKVPDLQSLSFNKIEIIYYKNITEQTSLQPVFLITGTAVLKDGTQAEVGLYLPAIKDQYLLK